MTKREKLVVSAYTGSLLVDFYDLHSYISEVLGRPVFTHELALEEVLTEIRDKTRAEFVQICERETNLDRLADVLFEFLDEFDVSDTSDLELGAAWGNIVKRVPYSTFYEDDLKAELKKYLEGVLYS